MVVDQGRGLVFLVFLIVLEGVFEIGLGLLSERCPEEMVYIVADFIYLVEALKKYDIEVLGRTKERWGSQREEGIKDYLKEHPDVEEYVILDDNQYGFDDYNKMWERFLDTKGKGIENATYASRTPAIETMLFLDAIKERS